MITVDEAFACAQDQVPTSVEVVPVEELDADERIKFDYLDATIEAGIVENFKSGQIGMFDVKIPADVASLRILQALIHHYESEGRWMIGIFAAEATGDLITTFQIVFAPTTSTPRPISKTGDRIAPVVRIIASRNRAGLSRDVRILQAQLRAAGLGSEVVDPDRNVTHRVPLQIHLENVAPDLVKLADRNVAIPNPELWVSGFYDIEIWAKTRHAEKVFRELGAKVTYIGWTSLDRMDVATPRSYAFLHVCGTSHAKGTDVLVRAWHPGLPRLTVVAQPSPWWRDLPECAWITEVPQRDNLRYIIGHISDDWLKELQNQHAFHIYPSHYEGYGHALWEGLSCNAIVIVPKGDPFDQFEGFVRIPSVEGRPAANGLVATREVSSDGIGIAINHLSHPPSTTARLCWEDNDRDFRGRIAAELAKISQAVEAA